MSNCCNGNCSQGRNCPKRKKEKNEEFMALTGAIVLFWGFILILGVLV